MLECPLCNAPIDVDEEELDEGDPLICEECAASLVVVCLEPLEISEAEEEFIELEEESDEDDPWRIARGY